MFIQKVNSIFDITWTKGIKYGDIHLQGEKEHSMYNFDLADVSAVTQMFNIYEKETQRLLNEDLVLPAFDYILKCSHAFNILDSRGAISVTERTAYIGRIRKLARICAKAYVEQRKALGFPLFKK